MHAAQEGRADIVELALKSGAQVNVAVKGSSPLLVAIQARRVHIVDLLLRHGASANFEAGAL
jgi:ankyrin repeat protein